MEQSEAMTCFCKKKVVASQVKPATTRAAGAQTRKRLVVRESRREHACKRTGEPSVTFCGKEERRSKAMRWFSYEIKTVASSTKPATTWS